MLSTLRACIVPPVFESEEKTRVAGLLHTILLSALGFAVLFGIMAPLLYEKPLPLLLAAAVAVPLWLAAFSLLRMGRVRCAAYLFLSVLWLVVTFAAVVYGGVSASAASTYITVIFAAGLVLGTGVGLGFAALSLVSSLAMLYAELNGLLPDSLVAETPAMTWVGLTTNLVFAAVLLRMAAGGILKTLEQARRKEQALRESKERYRTILESIEDGYFEVDLRGNFTFFNDSLCRIIGYPCAEMMGMNNRQYMDADNAQRVYLTFNQVYRTGEPAVGFDWELVGKDGARRCVEASVSLIRDASGQPTGFRGIVRDITERKRAEEAVRKSEAWLRTIVEGTHALLVHVDTRGRFVYVNEAIARLTGNRSEEMIGRHYLRFIHPDDRERVGRTYLKQVQDRDEATSMEFRVLCADGHGRWVNFIANPLYEGDHVVGQMGVAVDITEHKEMEQALRQRTAELEARNEELDAFSHMVAHDLQDPLSLIVGYADVVADDLEMMSPEQVVAALRVILQSGRKMGNIIDGLLILAQTRQVEVDSYPLDMGGIVAEALQRLAHVIKEQQAEVRLPETWPIALGNGRWIEEVWVNYLGNALKYGGRPPKVELGAKPQPDGSVQFWIRDNGPGLAREERSRLFTPFAKLSQTHVAGHGLGLSIVRRIVEKLGGQVGVESEGVPGRGCVFSFTLPGATRPDPTPGQ